MQGKAGGTVWFFKLGKWGRGGGGVEGEGGVNGAAAAAATVFCQVSRVVADSRPA